jgi:hypothetical protein
MLAISRVVRVVLAQLVLAVVVAEPVLLSWALGSDVTEIMLAVEAAELRWSVPAILLVGLAIYAADLRSILLATAHRRQTGTLVSVPAHLLDVVLVVEPVLVREFRQAHLVTAILVLYLLKVVLTSSDNMGSIVCISMVSHAVDGDHILVIVVLIAIVRLQVVRTTVAHNESRLSADVAAPVLRGIDGVLLSIDQGHPVDVVVLVVVSVFISAHN